MTSKGVLKSTSARGSSQRDVRKQHDWRTETSGVNEDVVVSLDAVFVFETGGGRCIDPCRNELDIVRLNGIEEADGGCRPTCASRQNRQSAHRGRQRTTAGRPVGQEELLEVRSLS
jgi:hypothetical protein